MTQHQMPSDPIADIIAERERQKSVEGWTAEHDDEHHAGQLAEAAACYASPTAMDRTKAVAHHWTDASRYGDASPDPVGTVEVPASWPWDGQWWKPQDQRRDLIKAGALILAELERLDRAEPTP